MHLGQCVFFLFIILITERHKTGGQFLKKLLVLAHSKLAIFLLMSNSSLTVMLALANLTKLPFHSPLKTHPYTQKLMV